MLLGSGIDVIDVHDVQRELSRGPWRHADGIFRDSELRHCCRSRHPEQSFASFFAAKEAVLKALGVPVADLHMFSEIEILPQPGPRFEVRLDGEVQQLFSASKADRILVALHANRHLATAMAVLEG